MDPYELIGKQVPAADGGDYGHLIVGFNPVSNDFMVIPIRWSTGEALHPDAPGPRHIDRFKASYRYQLDRAR